MSTFTLHIVTEDGELFQGEATAVNCNTRSGYITVLPRHVPLVSVLAAGIITVRFSDETGDKEQTFDAKHGNIDIRPTKVIILLHNGTRA